MKRQWLTGLLSLILLSFLPMIAVKAQSPSPTPIPATVTAGRCSAFSFPYGDWQISPGTTISSNGYVNSLGDSMGATLTVNNTFALYSISISWNPGIFVLTDFAILSADTSIQNADSDGRAIEHRQAAWNQNEANGTIFYFTQPANTITISLSKPHPVSPMYFKVTAICGNNGGQMPPIPDVPSATPTLPPTATSGGPTLTHTSPPNTPTATRTPTPTNTRRPTVTAGGPTLTLTASETTGAGTPTVTPFGGSPTSDAPGPINGGSFSTIPPPPLCGDALNPCGSNPFMPNGVPAYPTPQLDTAVPITAVPGHPTSTLIYGPYCPTASSGPTNTPCPTQTPNLTQTPSDLEGQITIYATNIYMQGQSIMGTPGLEGPDGMTFIDLANSGNEIGGYVGNFFGLVRAVQTFFLGKTGTIVAILLLILGFTLFVDFILFAIPIIWKLFDLLLQIVAIVLGMVP